MRKFLAFILATVLAAPSAFAVGSGGFENAQFSAKSLALSDAVTATPDEPAAISYNPAGIVDLPGVQVQGSSTFTSIFTWKESSQYTDMRSSGTINIIPTGYITVNPGQIFCDRLAFGVGIDSPFGMMNKYPGDDPAVNYTGRKNFLKMFSIKPVVAAKVTDKWSIGAGPVWYRIYDFGMIAGYPNYNGGAQIAPDGQMRLNANGNRFGWQLGTLYKFNEHHRLGFYFRSPVTVKTKGKLKVEGSAFGALGPLYGLPASGPNFETGATTKVNLPMNLTFGYAYQPTKKTYYELDFTWSRWKSFKGFNASLAPTGRLDDFGLQGATEIARWKNGYGIEFGVSHQLTEKLTLRGGSFFFWTPIQERNFSPNVPDASRAALSLGIGYKLTENITFDLSYYLSWYFERKISTGNEWDGKYTSLLNSATFSLTFHWDNIFPRAYKAEKAFEAPSISTSNYF